MPETQDLTAFSIPQHHPGTDTDLLSDVCRRAKGIARHRQPTSGKRIRPDSSITTRNERTIDPMIISTLEIATNPRTRTEILRTLTAVLGRSKVQPGCSASHLYEDIEAPGVILLTQEWKTQQDLIEHLQSDDYHRVLAAIELSDRPPVLHFDELSSRRGIEVVESARLRKGLTLM